MAVAVASAHAADGLIKVESQYPPGETMDRLVAAVSEKNLKVFARIDHAAGAASIGEELRPTELLIFGNPKVGTPLMQCQQLAALDLPQKALAYEDADGQVWLAYNDPQYIADRHNISGCDDVVSKISTALSNFSRAATR